MKVRAGMMMVVLAALVSGGCQGGLFPEGTPRSPYERYLTLRGEYRTPVEHDAYGRPRPALRQRLAPLD